MGVRTKKKNTLSKKKRKYKCHNRIPIFIPNMHNLVSHMDKHEPMACSWSNCGKYIIFHSEDLLMKSSKIQQLFRCNCFQSLIRQLNLYGFIKINRLSNQKQDCYYHQDFTKSRYNPVMTREQWKKRQSKYFNKVLPELVETVPLLDSDEDTMSIKNVSSSTIKEQDEINQSVLKLDDSINDEYCLWEVDCPTEIEELNLTHKHQLPLDYSFFNYEESLFENKELKEIKNNVELNTDPLFNFNFQDHIDDIELKEELDKQLNETNFSVNLGIFN